MEFWIQASAPRYEIAHSVTDTTVSDAVKTVFHLKTETAFIVWKYHFIPLGYKYGFSAIIDDLIRLIDTLMSKDMRLMRIAWPSNIFHAKWNLSWNNEDLKIDSRWTSVPGSLVEMLNSAGPISLKRTAFLSEWRAPLNKISTALIASGYDSENLEGLANIKRLVSALPKNAYLYQQEQNERNTE